MNEIKLKVGRLPNNEVETLSDMLVIENEQTLFTCCSLELPWKDNANDISCIPAGIYDCQKVGATAHIPYEHISVLNVPNRAGICIHYGNYAAGKKVDVEGCIIVGKTHADINNDGNLDVTDSRITLDHLLILLPKEFKLEITDSNNLS